MLHLAVLTFLVASQARYPTDLVVVSSAPAVVSEVLASYKGDPAKAAEVLSKKKMLKVHSVDGATVVVDYGSGPLAAIRWQQALLDAFGASGDPLARVDLGAVSASVRSELQPAIEAMLGERLAGARGRVALLTDPVVDVSSEGRTVRLQLTGASPMSEAQRSFLRQGPVARSGQPVPAEEMTRHTNPTFSFTVIPSARSRSQLLTAAASLVAREVAAGEAAVRESAASLLERMYGEQGGLSQASLGAKTYRDLSEPLQRRCRTELVNNYRWHGFESSEAAAEFLIKAERAVVGAELLLSVYEIAGDQRRFTSRGLIRYFP